MQDKVYDLLIVGAGPIGLSAAVGAAKRGCKNILVIDQTKEFTKAGDGVMVMPNATRALRLMTPTVADNLTAKPGYQSSFRLMNVDGVRLEVGEVDQEVSKCGLPVEPKNIGAYWYSVQRELLDVLPDDVAEVRTKTQVIRIENDPDDDSIVKAVCAVDRIEKNPFGHWNNDPASTSTHENGAGGHENGETHSLSSAETITLRARIVIGADGINSRIRAEMHRHLGEVEDYMEHSRAKYWGFSSVKAMGNCPSDALEAEKAVEDLYLQDGARMCVVGCRRELAKTPDAPHVMLVRLRGENAEKYGFNWRIICQCPIPEPIAQRLPEAGGHEALRNTIEARLREADYPDFLVTFVLAMLREDVTDGNRKFIIRPTYMVPVAKFPRDRCPSTADPGLADTIVSGFGFGRVFLAGDALHATPPFHAQGQAMGWEDVVELIDALATTLRWGENDGENTITNPDIDILSTAREMYKNSRLERLSKYQVDSLKRLWAHDETAFEEFERWLLNFVPIGRGWQKATTTSES